MAKKRSKRSKKMTLPIAVALPVMIPVAKVAKRALDGNFSQADFNQSAFELTGVHSDGKWDPAQLLVTYGPMLGGYLVHRTIGKPINRMLGNAKIPLLRV